MSKALIASLATAAVGIIGCGIFDSWCKAPEIGVVLSVALMGGFILLSFEDKK